MAHLGLFKQILFETDVSKKITLLLQCKSPKSDSATTRLLPLPRQRRQVAYPAVK